MVHNLRALNENIPMEYIKPDIIPSDLCSVLSDSITQNIRVERDDSGKVCTIQMGPYTFKSTGKQSPIFYCSENPDNDVMGDEFENAEGQALLVDASLNVIYLGFDPYDMGDHPEKPQGESLDNNRITIKTQLDGESTVKTHHRYMIQPNSLIRAVESLKDHKASMDLVYGNVKSGRSWLEIGGKAIDDEDLVKLCTNKHRDLAYANELISQVEDGKYTSRYMHRSKTPRP